MDRVTPGSFKRKSLSQTQRDYNRSKEHKNKQGNITSSLQCVTRSKSKNMKEEIEQPRCDVFKVQDTGKPFSPEPVDISLDHNHTPTSNPINNDLIMNNSNPPSHASVGSLQNINTVSEKHRSADYHMESISSPVLPPPILSPTVQPPELDDSTDSINTLPEDYPICTNIVCDYETGHDEKRCRDYSVNLYTCLKCSRPNGGSCTICENCKNTGAHARHEQYFIDYKTSKWFQKEYVDP